MSEPLDLASSLSALGEELAAARLDFGLDTDHVAKTERHRLADQIEDYLLPRLRRLDAPLLAVIGGSTGSGKSTITNSLVGDIVSPSGVLRPTTRSPVLVCHPDDRPWFDRPEILPDLARTDRPTGDTTAIAIRSHEAVPQGIGILDAPDIDSIEAANRDLAAQLLGAADLWIFVTTAARYADAVPWEMLHLARTNGTALALVVGRLPAGAGIEIVPHLRQMLTDADLGGVRVFPVDEVELIGVDGGAVLPESEIGELRAWLGGLGADADERAAMIRSTLTGALAAVPTHVATISDHLDRGRSATDELRSVLDRELERAVGRVDGGLGDGTELRSEVLDRWQELIGTGEFMKGLQQRVGRVRDVAWARLRGRETPEQAESEAIEHRLEHLIVDSADAMCLAVAEDWRSARLGRHLLEGSDPAIERSTPELEVDAGREVRAWQGAVLDLVSQQGQSKRAVAGVLSTGVNALGLAVMVLVFANTGGLTGAEIGVAGATATAGQALLVALFGEQAVRDLTKAAHDDLAARVEQLLAAQLTRFVTRLEEHAPLAERGDRLRELAAEVARAEI